MCARQTLVYMANLIIKFFTVQDTATASAKNLLGARRAVTAWRALGRATSAEMRYDGGAAGLEKSYVGSSVSHVAGYGKAPPACSGWIVRGLVTRW